MFKTDGEFCLSLPRLGGGSASCIVQQKSFALGNLAFRGALRSWRGLYSMFLPLSDGGHSSEAGEVNGMISCVLIRGDGSE